MRAAGGSGDDQEGIMDLDGHLDNACPNKRLVDESPASAGLPLAKLLFAHPNTDRPSAALKAASAIAASMHAELHIVSSLTRRSPPCAREDGSLDFAAGRRRIEECADLCRQTRGWCEDALGEPLARQRFRIRFGNPAEAIAGRAADLEVRLVILAPVVQPLGRTAIGVARACFRPVLVVRSVSAPGVVIAATDLLDNEYRVLRQASALGAALGARVVAVHNVSCLSTPLGACLDGGAKPAPELPRRMLAELPASLDLIVTTELDPVGAILEQAQQHRSGIIVVGTRSRSGRLLEPSVPSEIIDRSRCSVLVTSLGA
jgi:nucleotide-binding universal stress UspA family protein